MKRLFKATHRAWYWGIKAQGGERAGLGKKLLRLAGLLRYSLVQTDVWFRKLESEPMRPFVAADPDLALRPIAPYVSLAWGFKRRTKVVLDTYDFIQTHGGFIRECMLCPGGLSLVEFPVGKAQMASVHLGSDRKTCRGGEITLRLETPFLGPCKATLSFEMLERGLACYIGGIQQSEGTQDALRLLLRGLYGLSPRAFMVFLVQEIARSLRVRELLGVGNEICVSCGHKPQLFERDAFIPFDYDAFWRSLGGEAVEGAWFRIPLKAARLESDDIKVVERRLFGKRFALMDELSRRINTVLAPFHRND